MILQHLCSVKKPEKQDVGVSSVLVVENEFQEEVGKPTSNDISLSDKQNISVIIGLKKYLKKSTNLPYYAFLKKRERAREEERERRKREPLFSCSPRYSIVYTCMMLDHQVFLKHMINQTFCSKHKYGNVVFKISDTHRCRLYEAVLHFKME